MRQNILCLFLFLILSPLASAASQTVTARSLYTMADLEALEKEQSYTEFFDHAKDVRPGLRDKKWERIVKDMAMGLLNHFQSQAFIQDDQMKLVQELSGWYQLKEDEFFIRKRNQFAIKYYTQCFKQNTWENCYNSIIDYYNKFDNDAENGLNLARILIKANPLFENRSPDEQFFIKTDIWPLIKKMANSSLGEFYCHKDPMKLAVLNKLYTTDVKSHSGTLVHEDCLKALYPSIKENLLNTKNPFIREKSFEILIHNKKLNIEDKRIFYLIQLLDGMTDNKMVTLKAFEELKTLSESYKDREKVFTTLKSFIPLPGRVFSEDSNANQAIIQGFNRYFPEYLDYYSSTCLGHLEGSMQTKNGNPATYCHQFFKMAKLSQFVPKSKINQYDKIMNSWKK